MIKHKDITQDLLDVAQEILILFDLDNQIQIINRKGCEVLKCSQEDIIGQNWIDRFIPERNRQAIRQLGSDLMSGQIEDNEYREDALLTADGEERMCIWHNRLLYDEQGNIDGLLASGLDITEQKRMEEAIRCTQND